MRKLAMVVAVGVASLVRAGSAGLVCDPVVATPPVSSYVWGQGATLGNYTTQTTSTGPATTLLGVSDCQDVCVAAKARNAVGDSANWSVGVCAWPAPRVSSISPVLATAGTTIQLTVTGANFKPAPTVLLQSPGAVTQVMGTGVQVQGCTGITATFVVPVTASGLWSVEVTNSDRYYGSGGAVTIGVGTLPASPVNLRIVPRKNP